MMSFLRHLDEATLAEVADLGRSDQLNAPDRLHLEGCDRCQRLVAGHERASRLLSASWRLIPAVELAGSGVTALRPRVRIGSAFRSSDAPARRSWLRIAVVLGAASLLVVAGLIVASSRRPLPASTRFTFSLAMLEAGLISVNTDGSDAESIGLENGCCLDPTWSPDGSQLAFVRHGSERAQLVIVAAESPAEPRVVGDVVPRLEPDFEWSPDGKFLAGWDELGLVMVDAETGERLWTRPSQPGRGEQLSWSPDGSRILLTPQWSYLSSRVGALVVLDVATAQETFSYHAEHGDLVLVFHGAWSPDGSLFVYQTGRPEPESNLLYDPQILVMGQDGGPSRELAAGRNPTWSPDGAFIAFDREDEKGLGLSVIRPDGSGLRVIDADGFRPSWSPDGRQLAYCGRGERNGWFVADATGWEPRLVYETSCFYAYGARAAWQPTRQGD